jgi:hypothetical protein
MIVLISHVSETPRPMWRILVTVGESEVFHDSASSREQAIRRAAEWMMTVPAQNDVKP